MFTIDNETDQMTVIKKDTASFNIALDNYTFSDGDTVIFTIAREKESQSPLVQKRITTFKNGIATFILSSEDTNLDKGIYFYDIQVNTKDGRIDTVVGPAKFKVLEGVTY